MGPIGGQRGKALCISLRMLPVAVAWSSSDVMYFGLVHQNVALRPRQSLLSMIALLLYAIHVSKIIEFKDTFNCYKQK